MANITNNLIHDWSNYEEFVTAAQSQFPNLNVNEEINACSNARWKLIKQNFVTTPQGFLTKEFAGILVTALNAAQAAKNVLPVAAPLASPSRVAPAPTSVVLDRQPSSGSKVCQLATAVLAVFAAASAAYYYSQP